jgi:hypothetical protein
LAALRDHVPIVVLSAPYTKVTRLNAIPPVTYVRGTDARRKLHHPVDGLENEPMDSDLSAEVTNVLISVAIVTSDRRRDARPLRLFARECGESIKLRVLIEEALESWRPSGHASVVAHFERGFVLHALSIDPPAC